MVLQKPEFNLQKTNQNFTTSEKEKRHIENDALSKKRFDRNRILLGHLDEVLKENHKNKIHVCDTNLPTFFNRSAADFEPEYFQAKNLVKSFLSEEQKKKFEEKQKPAIFRRRGVAVGTSF